MRVRSPQLRPLVRTMTVPVAVTVTVLALVAGACSDDSTGSAPSTASEHSGHGGDGPFGSSMAPETVSVAAVAALGSGPKVGDTWNEVIGLNVCGRFLEPPVADGPPVDGIGTDGTGHFTVAPTTEAGTGHAATIGTLAQQVGITLSTGSVTLPASTQPAQIDVTGGVLPVAGATFVTGQKCGTVPAEVQLWVYTRDAANTGNAVRQVVTNPQDVPVVEDGMAFVIAFSPASSLPTLPPSALAG